MLTTAGRQQQRTAWTFGWYVLATLLLLAFLAPLGSALTVALTRTADLFSGSSTPLFPTQPTLEHFRAVWNEVPYLRWYGNSFLVASLFTLGQLTSCSLTAYALARIPFLGRTALLAVIVVTMMLPFQALMIPLFVLFSRVGWIDTLLPLWVPSFFGDITAAFGIFFLRQAFLQIPKDLPEAALMDGAHHGQILTRVYLPLVTPQLAVIGVLAFMASWNDFIRPIVYITSPDNMTVTGGLGYFQTAFNVQWGPLMTGSILSMIPILLIYVGVQRLFVRTLVSSGVKGLTTMTADVDTRIDRAVEALAGDMDDLLHALVATDTRSGSEAGGQELIVEALRPLSVEVETFEPDTAALGEHEDFAGKPPFDGRANVSVTLGQGDAEYRSIVLNGHVDTVPPVDGWTMQPFVPTVRSGRLYGLGAADMKAGLVGLVWGVRALAEAEVPVRGRVTLQSVVDEEAGGGSGTLACLQRGLDADAAIVAEPTDLRLCTAQMGSLAVRFEVEGRAAHGNTKWYGVNAIEETLPLLLGLRAAHEQRSGLTHPLLPAPQVNVGRIAGGVAAPIVANACAVEAVLSYHPGERTAVRRTVSDLVERVTARSQWLRAHPPSWSVIHDVDAYALDENAPIAASIRAALASDLDLPDEPVGFPAGSDARLLTTTGGIPAVLLGPGSLRQAHVADEYVDLGQFRTFPRLVGRILRDWTNAPRTQGRS